MVTDEERREIARKLRAAAVYLPNDIDSDDLEMAIATTVCSYDVPNVETLLNRLADLIGPSCDRDALLALADEMEGEKRDISCSTCRDDFGLACYDYKPNATCMEACLRYYARRIRKALGVDDG